MLAAAIAIGGMVFAGRSARPDPLSRLERAYLWSAPLPTLLAVVLPSVLGLAGQRPLADVLTNGGMALSVLQVVAGAALAATRLRRGARVGRRLGAGIALAAIPVLLLVVVNVLLRAA